MKRKILCLCLLIAVSGCINAEPAFVDAGRICEINSDCPFGQSCINNICIAECREERDCNTHQECDRILGQCINATTDAGPSVMLADTGVEPKIDAGFDSGEIIIPDAGLLSDAGLFSRAVEICVELNSEIWCHHFPNSSWASETELTMDCEHGVATEPDAACLAEYIRMYECALEIFRGLPTCSIDSPRSAAWVTDCGSVWLDCESRH